MKTSTNSLGFVHRFVPASEGSSLTLLLLHGTGGNETDLLPLGTQLAPGAAMLSPLGKVLENGMPRFFRRFAEGVFDLEDLKFRTHELASFVRSASTTYNFDPHNVLAVGYSNGANIAASMLMLHPSLLTGAILLRPMLPLVPDSVPDLSGVQVFIGSGQLDQLVPREETAKLASYLQGARAKVTLHWQPAGHALTRGDIEAACAWLLNHN